MSENDLQVRLQVAKQAAYIAGEELRRHGRGREWEQKSRTTRITEGLKLSQKSMTTFLSQVYPKEAIAGKNIGELPQVDAFWLVDSLSGENNFASGNNDYASVLTWIEKGQPVLGVIYEPANNNMFAAIAGSGATGNAKDLKVSEISKLNESFITTTFVRGASANLNLVKKFLGKAANIRVGSSPILSCVEIAVGSADGFVAYDLEPWDFASAKLMIEEAGGKITDTQGKIINLSTRDIIASNGKIHKDLL